MQGLRDSPFAYDSFTRVNPRKKRKGKAAGQATAPSDLLLRVQEELLRSDGGGWSSDCKEIFHEALRNAPIKPQKVLCLGLGSPSSSRDARAQLALLSYLCASARIVRVSRNLDRFGSTPSEEVDPVSQDSADIFVYDPVFTDADVQLIQTLGMRCLDHAQGAEHALECPTILYMPHCDLKLYETVIRANWTLDGLCNAVFLANHFGDYVDNNVGSTLEKESPCLMKLVPFIECRPLPTSDVFPSAFNNLSVQYVRRTPLLHPASAFWERPPCLESGKALQVIVPRNENV